jgi:hypothetical protein
VDNLDPAARALLSEGRQLHLGVLATTGPHVTPELYTYDSDHVWFLRAADTVKTRVVRRDPRAAAVVRVGSRSLLLTGDVVHYDLGDPLKLLTQAHDAMRALAALSSFSIRNAADLAAFARDLAAGRLPSRLPPRRVLLRLSPRRAALLDGTALLSTAGDWPGRVTVPDEAPPLTGDVDCVVAAKAPDGVAVMPGRVAGSLTEAALPAVAVQLADLSVDTDVAGALVVDDYNAPGPAAKSGALLRGTLRLKVDGALCRAEIDAERETTWDGAETHTASA